MVVAEFELRPLNYYIELPFILIFSLKKFFLSKTILILLTLKNLFPGH
jgi:hypothetical protein